MNKRQKKKAKKINVGKSLLEQTLVERLKSLTFDDFNLILYSKGDRLSEYDDERWNSEFSSKKWSTLKSQLEGFTPGDLPRLICTAELNEDRDGDNIKEAMKKLQKIYNKRKKRFIYEVWYYCNFLDSCQRALETVTGIKAGTIKTLTHEEVWGTNDE